MVSFVVVIKDISETKALETQLVALKAANNELNEKTTRAQRRRSCQPHYTTIFHRMNKAYEKIVGIKRRKSTWETRLLKRGHLLDLVSKYVLRNLTKNIFVKLKDKEVLLTGRPVFNEEGCSLSFGWSQIFEI